MKNIHLLSTDKQSRLQLQMNGNFHIENGQTIALRNYQNIYITSDERPNSDEYYIIDDIYDEVLKNDFLKFIDNNCKKIILTTDQDLIKDGVQEIDDEFLEWFVKNPSCEEVEVEKYFHEVGDTYDYEIIIPKKESTFYTKKCKCMIFEPNCFTGMCKNCGGILKEETKPKTMFESLQEYFKNTSKEKVLEDWNEFQHLDEEGITVNEFLENQKQETLEDAAKDFIENTMKFSFISNDTKTQANRMLKCVEFGAKW
jgi:hypothetical protein